MFRFLLLLALVAKTTAIGQEPETLPALKNGVAPQNFQEMWAGFDPRAEPLDVETIKEWEEDGVVLRIVRFRIGVFKGQKATLAGVYGFPQGGIRLPAAGSDPWRWTVRRFPGCSDECQTWVRHDFHCLGGADCCAGLYGQFGWGEAFLGLARPTIPITDSRRIGVCSMLITPRARIQGIVSRNSGQPNGLWTPWNHRATIPGSSARWRRAGH